MNVDPLQWSALIRTDGGDKHSVFHLRYNETSRLINVLKHSGLDFIWSTFYILNVYFFMG